MSNNLAAFRSQAAQTRRNIASIDQQIENLRARKKVEQRALRVAERAEASMRDIMDSMPPQPDNVLVSIVELAVADYRSKTISASEAHNKITEAIRDAGSSTTRASLACGKSVAWLSQIMSNMASEANRLN